MNHTHHALDANIRFAAREVRADTPELRSVSTRPIMRAEVAVVAALVLAIILGAVWPHFHTPDAVETTPVRVEQGQTLWALAAQHPVDGLTTEQTADLIASVNGLEGGLRAGAVIQVPRPHNDAKVAMR